MEQGGRGVLAARSVRRYDIACSPFLHPAACLSLNPRSSPFMSILPFLPAVGSRLFLLIPPPSHLAPKPRFLRLPAFVTTNLKEERKKMLLSRTGIP